MYKKSISILLAFVCVFTLCSCGSNTTISMGANNDSTGLVEIPSEPTDTTVQEPTIADDNASKNIEESVGESQSIDLNKCESIVHITEPGEYALSGELKNGFVLVETNGDVTLNLNHVLIINYDGPCIHINQESPVIINTGNDSVNRLTSNINIGNDDLDAAVYSTAALVFNGLGSMHVNSLIGDGIKCENKLVFESGQYAIDSVKDCVNADDDVMVTDCSFVLRSAEDEGMQSDTNLTINGGDFYIDVAGDGLRAEVLLTINDGKIEIVNSDEGVESKADLVINGGKININSYDDGINAIKTITINGGDIYVVSETNDAMDGNEKLTINGGKIYAVALLRPEGATDTANDGLFINGGTLIGLGAINSTNNHGTQSGFVITPHTKDHVEHIEIKDKSGNIVFHCDIDEYIMPISEQEFKDPQDIDWSVGKFANLDIGAPSFFISFSGVSDGQYDIYLNGVFNETIVVQNENRSLLGHVTVS